MSRTLNPVIDPKLDLSFERVVDVKPELVWMAWTQPVHVKKWFTPAPWKTLECEIDLRPGGLFRTVMCSPEGEKFPNMGCYLEVIENKKLTWTNALLPGFRPGKIGGSTTDFPFTASVMLEPHGKGGTKYTAIALHRDEESCKQHQAMGFEHGWGAALEQLVAMVKGL